MDNIRNALNDAGVRRQLEDAHDHAARVDAIARIAQLAQEEVYALFERTAPNELRERLKAVKSANDEAGLARLITTDASPQSIWTTKVRDEMLRTTVAQHIAPNSSPEITTLLAAITRAIPQKDPHKQARLYPLSNCVEFIRASALPKRVSPGSQLFEFVAADDEAAQFIKLVRQATKSLQHAEAMKVFNNNTQTHDAQKLFLEQGGGNELSQLFVDGDITAGVPYLTAPRTIPDPFGSLRMLRTFYTAVLLVRIARAPTTLPNTMSIAEGADIIATAVNSGEFDQRGSAFDLIGASTSDQLPKKRTRLEPSRLRDAFAAMQGKPPPVESDRRCRGCGWGPVVDHKPDECPSRQFYIDPASIVACYDGTSDTLTMRLCTK